MIITNCPAFRTYNVFGVDGEGCCYHEMKYCKDVKNCVMKDIVKQCKSWIHYNWESRYYGYQILSNLHVKEENEPDKYTF